eukprot:CFRG5679T1
MTYNFSQFDSSNMRDVSIPVQSGMSPLEPRESGNEYTSKFSTSFSLHEMMMSAKTNKGMTLSKISLSQLGANKLQNDQMYGSTHSLHTTLLNMRGHLRDDIASASDSAICNNSPDSSQVGLDTDMFISLQKRYSGSSRTSVAADSIEVQSADESHSSIDNSKNRKNTVVLDIPVHSYPTNASRNPPCSSGNSSAYPNTDDINKSKKNQHLKSTRNTTHEPTQSACCVSSSQSFLTVETHKKDKNIHENTRVRLHNSSSSAGNRRAKSASDVVEEAHFMRAVYSGHLQTCTTQVRPPGRNIDTQKSQFTDEKILGQIPTTQQTELILSPLHVNEPLRSSSDVMSASFHKYPVGRGFVNEENDCENGNVYSNNGKDEGIHVSNSGYWKDGRTKEKDAQLMSNSGSPISLQNTYNYNGILNSDSGCAVINIDDTCASDQCYDDRFMGSLTNAMPQPLAYEEYARNARVVYLQKNGAGLGISIKGGLEYELPILVARVFDNGPAAGFLEVGDVILSVNGNSLEDVSHEEAVNVLKHTGNEVRMEVTLDPSLQKLLIDALQGFYNTAPTQARVEKNDFVPTVREHPWDNDEIPQGWYKRVCPQTRRNYFVHPQTKVTTWLDPREELYHKRKNIKLAKKPPKGELPYGWEEVATDEGEVYYVNHLKKISQWDHPNPKKEKKRGIWPFRIGWHSSSTTTSVVLPLTNMGDTSTSKG